MAFLPQISMRRLGSFDQPSSDIEMGPLLDDEAPRLPSRLILKLPTHITHVDGTNTPTGMLDVSLPRFGPHYVPDSNTMLDAKGKCFDHVLSWTSSVDPSEAKESYSKAIRSVEEEAKTYYIGNEPYGRPMMLKDGCYFLQLAMSLLGRREKLRYPPGNLIFGEQDSLNKSLHAMFYVGNQIPLVVLKKLMEQRFFQDVIAGELVPPPETALCRRVLYELLVPVPPANKLSGWAEEQHSDILHGLYNYVLGQGQYGKKPSINSADTGNTTVINLYGKQETSAAGSTFHDDRKSFPSAVELAQAKICIRKLKTGGVRSICFKNYYFWATLYMPPFPIDSDTDMAFQSLIYYEKTQKLDTRGAEVSSYIRFMRDITRTSKDVKVLQGRGIINVQGNSIYEDDLPDMLLRLTSENTMLTEEFRVLRHRLREYSGPPWAGIKIILNLVAITAMLTLIQTGFAVVSYFWPHK